MSTERIIRGVMASSGIAIGHAIRAFDTQFISLNFKISPDHAIHEISRFRASVDKSRAQLQHIHTELRDARSPESSFLVDAHLLMLQDRLFIDRIVQKIEQDSINAEWAIQQVSDELYAVYEGLQDDYLRERRGDLEDIVRRMMHNLRGKSTPEIPQLPYDAIIFGRSIPPSTLFELRSRHVVGLVMETGSPLSHTAIMARSLGIPAVMGVQNIAEISAGELIVVDGTQGLIICSPSKATIRAYRRKSVPVKKAVRRGRTAMSSPCTTEDGVHISLGVNINFSEEVRTAFSNGTESIGLYRTEFDFFRDGSKPEEDALTADYSAVLKTARNAPVTFRTIDVGIDQKSWDGINSNLGARGLRFCLLNPDLFKTQLRAIFRAARHGRARLLLPFVSTVDELDAAREIISGVRRELARRKQAYNPNVPIGVMIETPAAAHTCDLMASRVDFFCLGTNDLIQYYLVIDRSDQSVAHLYNPFHPAILRCLHQVSTLLELTGKPITVCGEMAADPASAAILLGLGFTSLSVSLAAYPRMKDMIRSMTFGKLRELAGEILKMQKPKDVEDRVRASIATGMGRHA